jgi:hypothetical protein
MDKEINVEVNAEGIEDVTEKVQSLSDAIGAFPANVMIRNCRNCTFNIYPGQTMIMSGREEGDS